MFSLKNLSPLYGLKLFAPQNRSKNSQNVLNGLFFSQAAEHEELNSAP